MEINKGDWTMTRTTFGQVRIGQTIICNGLYERVTDRRDYAAGEPRTGPIGLAYPAVELSTEAGDRWGAPHIVMNVYEANVMTCGTCGHRYPDNTPAGRCPREYDHPVPVLESNPLTTDEAFFYRHAGWAHDPKTETSEEGRVRCAREYAAAEARGREAGFAFHWHPDVTAEPSAEGVQPWVCMAYDGEGDLVGSLGGVEFASDEPWGEPYRRVVEAELASEHLD